MTLLIIMVPLMVAATAIAIIPVLYHSIREHRLIHTGSATKARPPVDTGYSMRRIEREPAREKVAA